MGLAMFAWTADAELVGEQQVDIVWRGLDGDIPRQELFFWCKHPNLHGWMHRLYQKKGGKRAEFNKDTVRLMPDDLDRLEAVVRVKGLPYTKGFFFGESRPEERERDLEFIDLAREAIRQGKAVVYSSWW